MTHPDDLELEWDSFNSKFKFTGLTAIYYIYGNPNESKINLDVHEENLGVIHRKYATIRQAKQAIIRAEEGLPL